MAEYTPTTEDVVTAALAGGIYSEAEFDRWLAAYEAEVRERIATDIKAEESKIRGYVTPIERAVDVWLDDIDKRGLVLDPDIATQDVRAIFASIDTDELARALAPWLGTGRSANSAAEAVKAHLLKEDA